MHLSVVPDPDLDLQEQLLQSELLIRGGPPSWPYRSGSPDDALNFTVISLQGPSHRITKVLAPFLLSLKVLVSVKPYYYRYSIVNLNFLNISNMNVCFFIPSGNTFW